MTNYLSKDALLVALTHLHEETVDSPLLGGAVLVREPTAYEKVAAVEASKGDDPDAPADEVIARAFILQQCIVDASTGTPDAQGRIDPRTRAPLFAPDEVNALIHSREYAMLLLYNRIARLGGMAPDAFRNGTEAADSTGAAAGASAEEVSAVDQRDPE